MSELRRRILLASALMLLALGLLVIERAGYLDPLKSAAARPLIGLQRSFSTAYYNVRDFLTAPRNLAELRDENAQLQSQVSQLEAEVVTLRDQASELDVLRALLGFARAQPSNSYVTARVIGRDTSPFLRYLLLDQGSDAGVKRGMPVVSENGLVGRISEVSASASKVQLIIDPQSAINARVQETRAEGVLIGQPTGELTLTYLPQDSVVKAGDLVVTSGLGGGFPANILAGRVVSVRKRDYELYQTATVLPRVEFGGLEIVLIIANFEPVDIGPLSSESQP
jgi:rod shape-determining protein MreC